MRVYPIDDEIRRRGSDRLMSLPPWYDGNDLYPIMRVLSDTPTASQYDDLAVALSNFMEDLDRVHIDARWSADDVIGQLAPVMRLEILDRAEMRKWHERGHWLDPHGVTKYESLCTLYLHIPLWTGATRDRQTTRIDELARRHGLRCCAPGIIPET